MNHHPPARTSIRIGRVSFTFQRTLRIPDDGNVYPLPPGLGAFPIRRVHDFRRSVPAEWRKRGGYFIPLHQREAMWICFDGAWWRPNAVMIGVGGVNAVSGRRLTRRLTRRPQNYVVVPEQPWLDGINAGNGTIRQFIAMPLGQGYTVEAQVTGVEREGGLQLSVVEPKPGRFPSRAPLRPWLSGRHALSLVCESPSMGLAAGGRMLQRVYPDEYGLDTWDGSRVRTAHVHIVNSEMYRSITGEAPPPSPVSARSYTAAGLPWFELYDEHKGDVAPPEVLVGIKSVTELNGEKGTIDPAETLSIKPWQLVGLE